MRCYFCNDGAQGQCHKDGRFICRAHSSMCNGVFVCCECVFGGQEGILKKELEDLDRISKSTCPSCGVKLVPELIFRPGYTALTDEMRAKLRTAFSGEMTSSFCECVRCFDCTPKLVRGIFSHYQQCRVCGRKDVL